MMIGSGGAGKEPLILAAAERCVWQTSEAASPSEAATAMTACNSVSFMGSLAALNTTCQGTGLSLGEGRV